MGQLSKYDYQVIHSISRVCHTFTEISEKRIQHYKRIGDSHARVMWENSHEYMHLEHANKLLAILNKLTIPPFKPKKWYEFWKDE